MRKKLLMAVLSALTLLSMNVSAELISTDWKADNDSRSVLDTVSGKEWLKVTETDGMSIDDVQLLLDTTYAGWRLPSMDEVMVLLNNHFDLSFSETSNSSILTTNEKRIHWQNMFGLTNTTRSYGQFINNEKDENGRSLVMMAGTQLSSGNNRVYFGYNRSNSTSYTNNYDGIFLMNDGGVTLSSINNPSLNTNNPDAPVNNGSVSVPVSSSLALLGLALAGMSFRRKEK